ncbi:hypothetical protein Pfo_016160 [Paulownia fortunei]|nr:hypothetical protein Pfo_016160 [Paulownia fortunei]
MSTSLSITFLVLLTVFTAHSIAFQPKFKISNTFGRDDGENQQQVDPLAVAQEPAPPLDLEHHDTLDQQRVKPHPSECGGIHSLVNSQGLPEEEPPEEGPPVEEPPEEEPPPPPKPPKRKPPPPPPPRHGNKPRRPPRRPSCWPRCLPHRRKKPPPRTGALWPPKLPTFTPAGQQEPILL